MITAFLSLGGNVGDTLAYLRQALDHLHGQGKVRIIRRSSLYATAAWGPVEQPDFLNGVAEIETSLSPETLLDLCQEAEMEAGRERKTHWGARTLDVDILAYGDLVCRSDRLILPHPCLAQRNFVLVPWAEIAPEYMVQGYGRVKDLLAACTDKSWVEKTDYQW